ncbi:hypothetical protein [Methylobacter sp. YRD-M1]|uniref:hypothetical protein n=1 Tax=Methylobacter sp. YRD-M1 TaxID=2911520 RepID=UPI00227C23C1|nr:hypothetical protein [Methylobacter sp. YRD-M1]WAK03108.1 hypothetical protein LZ558_04795 [Methylobacter sp. YRD-M1]
MAGNPVGCAALRQIDPVVGEMMRLDTGPGQSEALSLYSSIGFRVIQPHYTIPEEMRVWFVFMELVFADYAKNA